MRGKRLPATPRGVAVSKRLAVSGSGSWPDRLLEDLPQDWPDRDREFVTALVQETTRLERFLDDQLSPFLKMPLERLDPPVREILRTAACQLCAMERLPAHAVVSEAVHLARAAVHEGATGLVNAVLRRLAATEDRFWSMAVARVAAAEPETLEPAEVAKALSLPDALLELWWRERGPEDAVGLGIAAGRPTPFALRVRTVREAVLEQLLAAGVVARPGDLLPEEIRLESPGRLADLPGYREGAWAVQGPAAMLATHVLDPQPGERVADLGAAPGGKTGHVLTRMQGQGEVWAVDLHPARLARLEANVARLRTGAPRVVAADATDAEELARAGLQPGTFDRVLLDVPCSGLGTLYRKADLRWRWSALRTRELARLQARMIRVAFQLLRPGGTLVYATCTLAREENEQVVEAFLAAQADAVPSDLARWLPPEWSGEAERGMMTLLPHRHGTEGFFLARLQRLSS